jgi:hypothetical protein
MRNIFCLSLLSLALACGGPSSTTQTNPVPAPVDPTPHPDPIEPTKTHMFWSAVGSDLEIDAIQIKQGGSSEAVLHCIKGEDAPSIPISAFYNSVTYSDGIHSFPVTYSGTGSFLWDMQDNAQFSLTFTCPEPPSGQTYTGRYAAIDVFGRGDGTPYFYANRITMEIIP